MGIESEVVSMRNEMTILRANILGGMDSYIRELGDEEIWAEWIAYGVPDECSEDYLMEMAKDEPVFNEVSNLFAELILR